MSAGLAGRDSQRSHPGCPEVFPSRRLPALGNQPVKGPPSTKAPRPASTALRELRPDGFASQCIFQFGFQVHGGG